MLVLRHASASSGRDAWNTWGLDACEGHIVLAVRLSENLEGMCVCVGVASSRRPRAGAISIYRLDETHFRLMPSRWHLGRAYGDHARAWGALPSFFDDAKRLPLAPILLTHAPLDVAEALAKL